jgi:polyphosphate kinase
MTEGLDPELSRIAFEDRLVQYVADDSLPLLERVRMLGIAAARMDTFFMTRIGRLKRLVAIGKRKDHGVASPIQLDRAAAAAHGVMRRAYTLLEERLLPELEANGVRIDRWSDLTPAERDAVRNAQVEKLRACVRPLGVRIGANFPHVRNLRPAVIAVPRAPEEKLAVIELPVDLPRFIPLPDTHRLVPLEDVIGGTLGELWPNWRFERVHVFRVTRSAIMDLEAEGEEEDVMHLVEQEVARRPFQEVVRAEFEQGMPPELRERLLRDLRREAEMQGSSLDERDMFTVERLIDLGTALPEIADLDLPQLKSKKLVQRTPNFGPHLIDHIRKNDVLVHFPYDDYDATVGRVLDEASRREDVDSIKIALYRAGKESSVVKALRRARARGVDVTASVELKASFDERDNIELARSLEGDGVRVLLSPPKLKVHAKTALISLRDEDATSRITMIGTGNLNPRTSTAYIDFWLLSADAQRAAEVDSMFDVLSGKTTVAQPRLLQISPFNMRPRFLEMIEREAKNAKAGKPSGIRVVVNGLSDDLIIDALRLASQAGVKIEMMVRGVCSLVPGVPGVSENIRVVSVVGQLLQHSRIFEFANAGNPEYYIGSADWRPRNMDHRVEVVTPVPAPHHAALRDALDAILTDRGAWTLRSDGVYEWDAGGSTSNVTAAGRT